MKKTIFHFRWHLLICILFLSTHVFAQTKPTPPSQEAQAALKQLEREPSIQEVQKQCLEFFRIDSTTVTSMRDRASWKAVMPSLKTKYRRNTTNFDRDVWDYTVYTNQVAGEDFAGWTTNEFEISGEWDLSRLVFNPELLDVSSLVVIQEAVLKEVTRVYFIRRRLQVDAILTPATDEASRLTKELRTQELTATLDAMTGGFFSKRIGNPAPQPPQKQPPQKRK